MDTIFIDTGWHCGLAAVESSCRWYRNPRCDISLQPKNSNVSRFLELSRGPGRKYAQSARKVIPRLGGFRNRSGTRNARLQIIEPARTLSSLLRTDGQFQTPPSRIVPGFDQHRNAKVRGSTIPSGVRFFLCWNAFSDASVAASKVPVSEIPKRRCTHVTR
jgi:hypothetical protein